jgi:hypothetical protein
MLCRLTLVVALLFAAGCGSEALARSPAAPSTVSGAVEQAMHGNGLKPRCTRLLSANFVREVCGSDARCEAAGGEKSGAQLPEGRATGVQVSGDRARVRITLPSAASGVLRLRREDGLWKLDRYDDDLVRAIFVGYVVDQLKRAASKPGLDTAAAQDCVDERAEALAGGRHRGPRSGVRHQGDRVCAPRNPGAQRSRRPRARHARRVGATAGDGTDRGDDRRLRLNP